ncbi:hypothetical protein TRFO_34486 [Tritrichomonas foetus]|uniref:Uncharacterized protein n=1 Tax=Tritrichomonas foetus TaxID=1144522 RepID=A0A1J4JJ08_9EUKA|nr:hypothetical protein TRFO_34486 [Tritrichomonas foetus]|eukprot:OHS99134.1 hypothetical protein TRFO_34486 [Tritrichomonas foetus]
MFFFLLSPVFSFTKGFHSFTVTHKKPFHIRLTKNLLVFVLEKEPPKNINFTSINKHNKSVKIPAEILPNMQFFDTAIYVSVPKKVKYRLHFWIVPTNLCSGISYSVTSDFAISYELHTAKSPADICIFGQGGASSYSTEIDAKFTSKNSRVNFYRNVNKPSRKCKPNHPCSYSSSKPFFIRVSNITGSEVTMKMIYKIKKSGSKPNDCAFRPIPYLIDGTHHTPVTNMKVKDIVCFSASEEWRSLLTIGVAVSIIVILIFAALQGFGCINFFSLFTGGSEDRFKALKANPFAGELAQEEAAEIGHEEQA